MDLDNGVEKNIKLLAEAKNKKISDINACVLKRPRHEKIVKELTTKLLNHKKYIKYFSSCFKYTIFFYYLN